MNPLIKALKIEFREFCSDYLVLRKIDDIFSSAGFKKTETDISVSGSRRSLVEEYYASVNWEELEAIQKFLQVIEHMLQLHYIPNETKDYLRSLCRDCGFEVENEGSRISYDSTPLGADSFVYQFPAGLPFGVLKPGFAVKAEKGGQTLKFELQSGLGLISSNVYPDLDFKKLEIAYGFDSCTNLVLKKALTDMNQTEHEKTFFLAYAHKFDMANKHVPVLIPQAWIQWHSLPKKNLRSISSLHTDDLYRVDFVAFWRNKRYAILVDDISHYAVKQGNKWIAYEEAYAKRLKEDRKLRKEKWQVFRVSNWELRDKEIIEEILEDLRVFIGFE